MGGDQSVQKENGSNEATVPGRQWLQAMISLLSLLHLEMNARTSLERKTRTTSECNLGMISERKQRTETRDILPETE